jgi:phospholipid transport system substrate-binding protein
MIRLERMASIVLTFLAIALASPSALAESATDFVKERQNKVVSILHDQKAGPGRDKQVREELAKMIDYDHLARQSLASHWDALKDDERKEFTDVLTRLVQNSYEKNIKEVVDFDVEYLAEEAADAGGAVTVKTRAKPKAKKGDEPITIDYRLDRPGSGKWRVVDIITEESSLVGNYKSQFHRTFQKEGFSGLINKMKNRLAKNGKP